MILQKIFIVILSALNIRETPKCRLNTRLHFNEPLPVIIRSGEVLQPNDKYGNVILEAGDVLTLSCTGSNILSHPNAQTHVNTADIICEAGEQFKNDAWLNISSSFSGFRCSLPPEYNSKLTNRTCYNNNHIYEVGYNVNLEFYPIYESCFNRRLLSAIYSKYTQKHYNGKFQTKVDRPYFKADDTYGDTPVESLFSPRGLQGAIEQLVGSKADMYITVDNHLSRGHLAAKADFVFAFGQRSTFHYVNCAPQWYKFNSGNWNNLEIGLRDHISETEFEVIIYTGTYEVSSLKNNSGREVSLYLYTDVNNNPVIPIPLYYYKVVYEPNLSLGVAFVGINNPFYNMKEARELFFCNDRCRGNSNYNWLRWNPDDPAEGFMFCCEVDDFRSTVHHLPYFTVSGLLH